MKTEGDPTNNQVANLPDTVKAQWDALVLNSEGPNKKADYLNATRKEDYLQSESGKLELEREKYLDDMTTALDEKVAAGSMTREEANKQLEEKMDEVIGEIDEIRQHHEALTNLEAILNHAAAHHQEIGKAKASNKAASDNGEDKDDAVIVTDDNGIELYTVDPSKHERAAHLSLLAAKGKSANMQQQTGSQPVGQSAAKVTQKDSSKKTANVKTPAQIAQTSSKPASEPKPEVKPKPDTNKNGNGNKSDFALSADSTENATQEQPKEPEITQPVHEASSEDEIQDIKDKIAKTDEELKQARANIDNSLKELAELNQKYLSRQLIGVNADLSHDREILIRDRASDAYATEKSEAGFFKRARMNFFENYYKKKYAKEIDAGKRKIIVDGKEMTLDEALQDRSKGAIGRFVSSVAENDLSYLYNSDGENRTIDQATTNAVRDAIIEYAKKRGTGADEKIFKEQLREKLAEIEADSGEASHFNNYFDVAENAIRIKDMARGAMSLEQVLENFKVYNASVRESYSSETRKENIANIITALKRNGFKGIVNSDQIIVAAESATLLTRSGLLANFSAWNQPAATTPADKTAETAPATAAIADSAPAPQPVGNTEPATKSNTANTEPATIPVPASETQPKNHEDYYSSYENLIGKDGVNFFSAIGEDVSKPETHKKFADWWNGLGYEGKRAAYDLAIDQNGPSSGNAIKMWVSQNTRHLPPTPDA